MLADGWYIISLEYVGWLVIRILRVGASARLPLTLNLVKQSDVFVEFHKTHEGNKLAHNWLFEVSLNAEIALHNGCVENFHLLRGELIVFIHLDCEWVLVGVVVEVDEAVVEEEASVALFTVRIVNLFSTLDLFKCLNDEALTVICICPASLAGTLVIKHVSIGHKSICFHTHHLDAKDSASHHHSNFRVLLQRELSILGDFRANRVVVLLNVLDFLADLVLEGAAFKPCALYLGVKDGEIIERLGQYIDVLVEPRVGLSPLLHNISCQEGVLW